MDHFTCQHVVGIAVRTLTVNYTEIVVHVHAVDTRPTLPLPQLEGLGTRLVKGFKSEGSIVC